MTRTNDPPPGFVVLPLGKRRVWVIFNRRYVADLRLGKTQQRQMELTQWTGETVPAAARSEGP